MRRSLMLTALLLHAPGLRVLHGLSPSARTLRYNVLAVAATLAAMWLCGSRYGLAGIAGAWAAGHLAWGGLVVLAVRRGRW